MPGVRRVSGFTTIRERNRGGLCLSFPHHVFEDPRLVRGRETGQVCSRTGSGYLTAGGVARPQNFHEATMYVECVDAVIMRIFGQDTQKSWQQGYKGGPPQ